MSIFEEVKQSVTTRQAAERYGVRVGRERHPCKSRTTWIICWTRCSPPTWRNGRHIHAQFYRVICVK